jgi:biotin carboxyl carrier protein
MSLVKLKLAAAALVLVLGLLGTGTTVVLRQAPALPPAEPGAASALPAARGVSSEELLVNDGEAKPKPATPETAEGRERQEVPAEREGKLIFLGTEIKPGEKVPPGKVIKVEVGFLAVEIEPGERIPAEERIAVRGYPGKEYRRVRRGDDIRPDKCVVTHETKAYRKLGVGDRVVEGQLLGLVNPAIALDELAVRVAKLDAAEADRRASLKTRDEYKQRWENMLNAVRRTANAVSQDDIRAALFQYQRYLEEEVHKAAKVRQAEGELRSALTILQMHEIRSSIRGVIKRIYIHRGEAVKNLEAILVIQGVK